MRSHTLAMPTTVRFGFAASIMVSLPLAIAFFRTPLAFGAVVILALLGIVLFQAVSLAERLLFPWSSGAERPALAWAL